MSQTLYDFSVNDNANNAVSLDNFKGKILLIVNTASKCGFTPQYEGLENLQKKYEEKGFSVLAFPCNQFGNQEPGNNNEIQEFCSLNFQTSFPVMSKIDVNGENADPLFNYLKSEKKGLLGSKGIKWNFTKFLVDQNGEVIKRYSPNTEPKDIAQDIENLL
ncbi:MAG: glutathione peroxidase [Gammaproteobacteria bacterium]|nr:MAG: glutathione peroxidase [Gammaproteobacteria bacterium TMED159]|tara:strand:- start:454 stop:936 length:483 start_codon:yes stop_codon:yes gene_type:complete